MLNYILAGNLQFKISYLCFSGYYPRYTSIAERIYYEPCQQLRYQPWPVKSYEITECEFEKSSCTGIGQILFSVGNFTNGATCSCDYKNGYVMTGPDTCCSPTGDEDCSCIYHPCQSDLQELESGVYVTYLPYNYSQT